MNNFELHNPVKLIFGKGEISKVSSNIPSNSKVLLTYGGGSIMKNGVYSQVMESLSDFNVVEFGGIEANPQFSTLMKAVEIARLEKIDFILAVGGGSVLDGTKFISTAIKYSGDEWNILKSGAKDITDVVPFGAVLTIPATGSEMNSGGVVSRKETGEKLAFGSPLCFPKFSILDPSVVSSLPKRQLVNGVVDAFVHVLEQYITYPNNALIQDRFAEGILLSLIEIGDKVIENPENYDLASNLMFSATMALNGLIGKGVPSDWATHMIGHELTALYNIDHAQTLSIILPHLYLNQFESKKEKLAQYGRRVWNLDGTVDEIAKMAIEKTVLFFNDLGMKQNISDFTSDYDKAPKHIRDVFIDRGWKGIGERGLITPDNVYDIVSSSL